MNNSKSAKPTNSKLKIQNSKIKTMLKGKKIVLGITGSIAAYKSCLLIREFVKQ